MHRHNTCKNGCAYCYANYSFRGFMMRVSIEMPVKIRRKIRRKIRCGIGAEEDDSSAQY